MAFGKAIMTLWVHSHHGMQPRWEQKNKCHPEPSKFLLWRGILMCSSVTHRDAKGISYFHALSRSESRVDSTFVQDSSKTDQDRNLSWKTSEKALTFPHSGVVGKQAVRKARPAPPSKSVWRFVNLFKQLTRFQILHVSRGNWITFAEIQVGQGAGWVRQSYAFVYSLNAGVFQTFLCSALQSNLAWTLVLDLQHESPTTDNSQHAVVGSTTRSCGKKTNE